MVGAQVSKVVKAASPEESAAIRRWFGTYRLAGNLSELPDLPPASWGWLGDVLSGSCFQVALSDLLTARLTDAPEPDASRARHAVQQAISAAAADAIVPVKDLVAYYDDQIGALIARLEVEQHLLLAKIRCESAPAQVKTVLYAGEPDAPAPDKALTVSVSASQGVQAGNHNLQVNNYFLGGDTDLLKEVRFAAGASPGRLLAEVTDPFSLEVHRAVQSGNSPAGLPALPPYVTRDHDLKLAELVQSAADGVSGIAVLVGGSSTGKTRACWEALRMLRERPDPWRLWHPIDPSRPQAALRGLTQIGPQTVVWLNEAQLYLDVPAEGLGERIAAGLREAVRDPARAPVLVLATLWPQHWGILTTRPLTGNDSHAQARELLAGRDIAIPASFSAPQLRQLSSTSDPRLAHAARASERGQVTQFLAGAPELAARYRNAPPAAAALISTAMDARRLGMGIVLPLTFLEAAAPAYMTETEWSGLPADWLEQGIAYTTAPCNGIPGPLTRLHPRPGASADRAPAYRLADYLEQLGRIQRGRIPPTSFWDAAAYFARPADLPPLAASAQARGLLRHAALLRKQAAVHGDTAEAAALLWDWNLPTPLAADPRPWQWAAEHAALDDPGAVAALLTALRRPGASHQLATLLARNPAANVILDSPGGVAAFLDALRGAGAKRQIATLMSRAPAAYAILDNPCEVAALLDALRKAGAEEQFRALADRAADHALLRRAKDVATLIDALVVADAHRHVAAVAFRAAEQAAFDDPRDVATLIGALTRAGAERQANALTEQAGKCAPLNDPGGIAALIDALVTTGANGQITAMVYSSAERVTLDDLGAVAALIDALSSAGAERQAAGLAKRAAEHTGLDNPARVARLLHVLRKAGAKQQIAALLARDPANHATLDSPASIAALLEALRRVHAHEQVTALATRAAEHTAIDNRYDIDRLVKALRNVSADGQATILLTRAAEHAALGNPASVASLMDALREAAADQQAAALLSRCPAAHTAIDNPYGVAWLLNSLRRTGANQQIAALLARSPAANATLDNKDGVKWLIRELKGERDEQAGELIDRLPAEGMFDIFCQEQPNWGQYRYGREPGGLPAPSWNWNDLD